MAKHLGFEDENIPVVDLKRLPKPQSSPAKPAIVCRFALLGSRRKFFRSYLANLSLCLTDVGYTMEQDDGSGSCGRIFINESLSKRVRDIRSLALQMRKSGHVQKVLTKDGVIHVKLGDNNVVPCHSKQSLLDKLNLSI